MRMALNMIGIHIYNNKKYFSFWCPSQLADHQFKH